MLKESLQRVFSIKDLGPVKRCLGIDVIRDRGKGIIKLSQANYVEDILRRFNMEDCKEIFTPMEIAADLDPTLPTNKATIEKLKKTPYQSAVGALIYLTQATRPDLAYAVSSVSRFNSCYNLKHWDAVKRIFRYVQRTKMMCLQYSKDQESRLTGFCDASYAPNPHDPRSVSGYVFVIQGGAISWISKRQQTVARSTTETEYLSLTTAGQEAIWLKKLTIELEMQPDRPLLLYCDNKGSIDLSKNARFSPRTKHVNVRQHFLKDNIEKRELDVKFVPSADMVADSLTKATTAFNLEKFNQNIGLKVL